MVTSVGTFARTAERLIGTPNLPTEVSRPEVVITSEARNILGILVDRAIAKKHNLHDPNLLHEDRKVAIVVLGGALRGFGPAFVTTALVKAFDTDKSQFPITNNPDSHSEINPFTQTDLLIGMSVGAVDLYLACAQKPEGLRIFLEKIPFRGRKRNVNDMIRRKPPEREILSYTRAHFLDMDALRPEFLAYAPSEETMRNQRAQVYAVSSTKDGETRVTHLNPLSQEEAVEEIIGSSWAFGAVSGSPIMRDGQQVIDGGFAKDGDLVRIAVEMGATDILVLPTTGIGESADLVPKQLFPALRLIMNGYMAGKVTTITKSVQTTINWLVESVSRPNYLYGKSLGGIFMNGSKIRGLSIDNKTMSAEGNHIYSTVIDILDELTESTWKTLLNRVQRPQSGRRPNFLRDIVTQ